MEITKIKVNSAAIEAGDWVGPGTAYGEIPGCGDLRLKVRGIGSHVYRDAVARRTRAIPKGERHADGTLPSAVSDRVAGAALAEATLLDWDNLTLNGVPTPFSSAAAESFLTDPDFSVFQDAVLWAAGQVAAAAAAREEEIVGNSGAASPGSLNGATAAPSA